LHLVELAKGRHNVSLAAEEGNQLFLIGLEHDFLCDFHKAVSLEWKGQVVLGAIAFDCLLGVMRWPGYKHFQF
jgi:hypothetical protein